MIKIDPEDAYYVDAVWAATRNFFVFEDTKIRPLGVLKAFGKGVF